MRALIDAERIRRFMRELGSKAVEEARVYFTGGATAVLQGWRASTIDLDLKLVPESDALLRALPALKESLSLNIELASPDQFIPPLEGWRERSPSIAKEGKISFFHYDLYAQALAKIERGHQQDLTDVREMLRRGLVDPVRLREHFERIEPLLYRYPALDPKSFRQSLDSLE